MKHICQICNFIYDSSNEEKDFDSLPEEWLCPVCTAPKALFNEEKTSQDERKKDVQSPNTNKQKELEKSSKETDKKTTTSKILIDSLQKNGLTKVFGMVGHSNLPIADAIRQNENMTFITTRHESAASFAASAYGKLLGKPAACLSIAGPGATNLLTGISDAHLDQSPMIALMGQVDSNQLDFHLFQELNLLSIFQSVATNQYFLFENSSFDKIANNAYCQAILNKGVSQILVPNDVQNHLVPNNPSEGNWQLQNIKNIKAIKANENSISEALCVIQKAKNPLLIVGNGAKGAKEQIKAFAKKLNIALCTTYRAKGIIEDSFEYSCGVLGRSGTPVSANLMAKADLIIALGVGFSNHTNVPNDKNILQIDNDIKNIGRRKKVSSFVLSDCKNFLEDILKIAPQVNDEAKTNEIKQLWQDWKNEKQKRQDKSQFGSISPAFVCNKLNDIIPQDAIVCVDVGNVAYSFGRYFEAKNQTFLCSWYLGSIGVSLPSAIGSCLAAKEDSPHKGKSVFAIAGDGGFGQYLADWTTAVKYNLPIKCIVFNNSQLGKISTEQKNASFKVWETSLTNPSFALFAQNCGSFGIKVEDPKLLEEALKEALKFDGPALVEIITNPELL